MTEYFKEAKKNLIEWAAQDQNRLIRLYNTFGTIHIDQMCDQFAYRQGVITWLANIMGASEDDIKNINNIKDLG